MNKKMSVSLLSLCFSTTFYLLSSAAVLPEGVSEKIYIEPVRAVKIVSLKKNQQKFLWKRGIVKNSMYGTAIFGAVFLAQHVAKYEVNKGAADAINAFNKAKESQATDGVWNWIKSIPGSVSTLFKIAVPAYFANEILAWGGSRLKTAIADPIKDESLYWFYYNHTKITDLIEVIKLHSVSLDPDSFYLDYETNQMGQKVALQEFMQDVKVAVSNEDSFLKSLLPQRIVRRHVRQAQYLAALEDDALITEGMRRAKRFVADSENDPESAQKHFSRKIIQSFVSKMKSDIEKILAFALARYSVLSINNDMVQQLIALTNEYLRDVEDLLNLSDEELAIASQEKRGLFTKIFMFSKRFNDSLKTLNVCLNWK